MNVVIYENYIARFPNHKRVNSVLVPLAEGAGKGNILGNITHVFCKVANSNPRLQTPWQENVPMSQVGLSSQVGASIFRKNGCCVNPQDLQAEM